MKINSKRKTLGILYDFDANYFPYLADNIAIANKFKNYKGVAFSELGEISPQNIPVLVVLSKESFPKEFIDELEHYLSIGGTVVFPEGAPLYYEKNLKTGKLTEVGRLHNKRFHLAVMFNWDKELKDKISMSERVLQPAYGYNFTYSWSENDIKGAIYFSDKNLQAGDKFIPVYYLGRKGITLPVVAIYKLNSSLKGNIIIQGKPSLPDKLSEYMQSVRLPRLFLCAYASGIDKVAWYDIRMYNWSLINEDLSYKQAAYSYKTLTKMCPSGSTRPKINIYDDVYIASWITPNGNKISSVWSIGPTKHKIKISGLEKAYSIYGNQIYPSKGFIIPTPELKYFQGEINIDIQ